MTETLFPLTPAIPDSVLLSIYNAYPRKENRKDALKRIAEALDRICAGEIDGQPRTQPDAIQFLRVRTEWVRREMFGREPKWIPHPTTYYHQSRYLRPAFDADQLPARLEAAVRILACYPKMPDAKSIQGDVKTFLPSLMAIDRALTSVEKIEGPHHTYRLEAVIEERLTRKTKLYAMAVAQWPVADLQFVPNAAKWFGEHRYEHDEQHWGRQGANGFDQERQQLERIINRRTETGSGGNRPN